MNREDLVRFIPRSTGLDEGDILQVVAELRDAVAYRLSDGRSVRLEELGIYAPVMGLDGEMRVGYRVDVDLKAQVNVPSRFRGAVRNRDNIGKSGDDLVALWNADNPNDPVPKLLIPIHQIALSLPGKRPATAGRRGFSLNGAKIPIPGSQPVLRGCGRKTDRIG